MAVTEFEYPPQHHNNDLGPLSPSARLQRIYRRYHRCVLHFAVKTASGDWANGTGFHIGEGWVVTARHVIDNKEAVHVQGGYYGDELSLGRIVLHDEPDVDLALIETNFMSVIGKGGEYDHIEIGGHFNDYIDEYLVMNKVLLMGYPPVPFAKSPVLVAVTGDVSAIVDRYSGTRHPYFIISAVGRGGFSGGPVVGEDGTLMGVMTEVFLQDNQFPENGFTGVLTVEPLLNMLATNEIFPGDNADLIRYWTRLIEPIPGDDFDLVLGFEESSEEL